MCQNDPDRATLASRLQAILSNFSQLPSASSTGSHLTALADVISNTQTSGVVSSLETALIASNASAASFPSTADISGTINALEALVDQVKFPPVYAVIDSLNATIQNFPSDSPVLHQLQLVINVPSVLPCMVTLVDAVTVVNTSLFLMPPVCGCRVHVNGCTTR